MAYVGFILVEGLKGQSAHADFNNLYSDILSFNFGLSQRGIQSADDNPYESRVNFDELEVTKFVDSATTGLFAYCTGGQKIKHAYVRTDEQKVVGKIIMSADLYGVTVSSIRYIGNPGHPDFVRPVEEITFKFDKIEIAYHHNTTKGTKTFRKGWDLGTNETWTSDK